MPMAASTRRWTIADWERLPRDGNRYEVVAGELFVTPMPTPAHQIVVQRLWEALLPYVRRWNLGSVFAAGVDVFVGADEVIADVLRWHPAGAGEPLEIELGAIFR
jgi:Uma2 family endonuclease